MSKTLKTLTAAALIIYGNVCLIADRVTVWSALASFAGLVILLMVLCSSHRNR